MTIEIEVSEECRLAGEKAARDLQAAVAAGFRPKIAPGVFEGFRIAPLVPAETAAKLQQSLLAPKLREQMAKISAAAVPAGLSEALAAKFADISRQAIQIENADIEPWAAARERDEMQALLGGPDLAGLTVDTTARDAAVRSTELLVSMVDVLKTMAEQSAETARVDAWRFRWVMVPLLVLTALATVLVPVVIEILR